MNSDQLELVKQLDNKISKAHGTENINVDELKAERAKLVKRIEELKDNERIKEELERTKKVFEKHNEDTDKIESELAIKEHMLKALRYREIREAEARIKEIDEIIKKEEKDEEKKEKEEEEETPLNLDNIKKPDDLIKSLHLDETKLDKKNIKDGVIGHIRRYITKEGQNKYDIVRYAKNKSYRNYAIEMFKIIDMYNEQNKNKKWLLSTAELKKEAGWEEKEDDKPLKIEDLKTEEEPKKEETITDAKKKIENNKKEVKENMEKFVKDEEMDNVIKVHNKSYKELKEYMKSKEYWDKDLVGGNAAKIQYEAEMKRKIHNFGKSLETIVQAAIRNMKRSDFIKLGKSNEVLTSSPIYNTIMSWIKSAFTEEQIIRFKKDIIASLNSHFYYSLGLAFYDVKPKKKNITDKTITPKKNARFRIIDRLGFLTRAKREEETKIKEKKKKLDVVSEKINKPFFSFDINKIYWIVENVGNVVLSDRGREDLKDLIQNEVNNYNNTQYFIKLQKLEKGKKRIERRKAIQEYIRNNVKSIRDNFKNDDDEVANHGLEKYNKVYENIEAYLSERAGENKTFKLSKVAKDNIKRIIESSEKREGKNKVSIMDKINSFHI